MPSTDSSSSTSTCHLVSINALLTSPAMTSLPMLGKRLRETSLSTQVTKKPTPPSSPNNFQPIKLLSLPDEALLRIFYFLCGYKRPFRPPRIGILTFVTKALQLAVCNTRLLRIFRKRILQTIDAVPNQEFLDPIARCDDRFKARHPKYLCRIAKLASNHLKHLILPMYDSTMEDAHWDILDKVESMCNNLNSLSFVDSTHHSRITPIEKQTEILNRLLPRIVNLQLFFLRSPEKVNILSSSQFQPKKLALYKLDPCIHAKVVKMLSTHSNTLTDLTLSFDGLEGMTDFTNFCKTVMKPLANLVNYSMDNLESLQILVHPITTPAATLQGPFIGEAQSRREFNAVSNILDKIRSTPTSAKPLKSITIERFCPNVAVVIDMFQPRCAYQTEISIYLHEVLLVSPRRKGKQEEIEESNEQLPYFLATALHSSSWMLKELPKWYFRRIEHIRLHADEEAKEGVKMWFDRMFPSTATTATPDMRGFRFLCENAGPHIRTIIAKLPTESVRQANTLFRILSNGLSFARNVQTLMISGDLIKFVGLDHKLLYTVVGQLSHLEELCVDGASSCDYDGAQLKSLPILLHALRTCCNNLQMFKMEISADLTAAPSQVLQQSLISVRRFEQEMVGVITNNLEELLEVSLKGSWKDDRCFIGGI